ncbi:MAG: hypothetical protein HKP27_00785 [Myxococcales bacterium]|nr:hypothetical protein [Myxococcales bacterium]
MRRFRFRLQRLLELRQLERQRDEAACASSRAAHARAAERLAADRQALAAWRRELDEELRDGVSGAALRMHHEGLGRRARAVEGSQEKLAATDLELAAREERQLGSRKRHRSVEKLRERAVQDDRTRRARALQAALDEMVRRGRKWTVLVVAVGLVAHAAPAAEDPPVENERHGVVALLDEIRTRNAELDRRERELDDRERTIEELENVSREQLQEVREIAATLSRRIAAWEEANGDAIRRLSKIYAAMPAPRAATLIEELDLRLATQILAKMKHKESAGVLALLDPIRALAVTRHVAHPLSTDPPTVPGGLP